MPLQPSEDQFFGHAFTVLQCLVAAVFFVYAIILWWNYRSYHRHTRTKWTRKEVQYCLMSLGMSGIFLLLAIFWPS